MADHDSRDGEANVWLAKRTKLVIADAPLNTSQISHLLAEGDAVLLLPALHREGRITLSDSSVEDEKSDRLIINLTEHRAYWRTRPLAFTEQELQVLALLANRSGAAVSHRDLSASVWKDTCGLSKQAIASAIKRLRRKLKVLGVPAEIECVRGFGFRLGQSPRVMVDRAGQD